MKQKYKRRWLRRFLIAVLLAVTSGAAACWGLQSTAFEAFLVRRLPGWARSAGLRLAIGNLDLNLWPLSLRVDRLSLGDQGSRWSVEAPQFSVGVNFMKSLGGTPHLQIEAESPSFRGSTHLAEKSKFEMPDVVFDTVRVTGGKFSLTDLDSGAVFSVPDIELRWLDGSGWGRATGGGATWKGTEERLREFTVTGSRRFGILRVDQSRLTTDRLRVSASGRLGLKHLVDASLDAQVSLRELPDAWVTALGLADYLPIAGTLSTRGQVYGRLEEPRFRGTASLSSGRFGPVSFQGGTLTLEANEKELAFRNLALRTDDGEARGVAGKLSWVRGVALEVRGEAVGYDLRPFMALFVKDFFPVGLKASGTFETKGSLYPKLDLACKVDAVGSNLDVTTIDEEGSTTWFALPQGRITGSCRVGEDHTVFGPTVVDGGTLVVRIPSARVDYETGVEFDTDVEITNLDLVRQYLPEKRGRIDTRGRAHGRFGGPYEALTFSYRLDLDSITLLGQPMGAFQADATFDLKDLVVTNGSLQGPMGRIDTSGKATLRSGGALALEADWTEGDLSAVADFIRVVAPSFPKEIRGSASGVGRVVGTIEEPIFDGAVAVAEAHVLGADVDEARLDGALGLTRWEFDRLWLSAYGAQVDAKGWADLDGFEVDGTIHGLSLAKLDKLVGKSMPVGAVFDGRFQGHGPYSDLEADLGGAFTQGSVIGYSLGDGTVSGQLRHREVKLDVKAFAGAGTAAVRIGLEGQRPLAVDVEARRVPWALVPPGLIPELVKGDSLSGRGRVVGGLSEGQGVTSAHWEGTVAQARANSVPIGELSTRVEYDGIDLQLFLNCWAGEAAAELVLRPGQTGVPMKTQVRTHNLDLARLSALTGVPAGRVSASGQGLVDLEALKTAKGWTLLAAVKDLAAKGNASGIVGPEWLKIPPFTFTASNSGGRPELVVLAEGIEARAVVEDLDRRAWSLEADLRGTPLASLVPEGHPIGQVGGTVQGEIRIRGADGKVTEGSAHGDAKDLAVGPLAPSRWSWSAKLQGGLAAFELREPRGITATGTWEAGEVLKASLRLAEVPLAGWTTKGMEPEDFRGTVSGSGEVRLPSKGDASGHLRLQRLSVELPPVKITNQGDILLGFSGRAVQLEAVKLAGDGFDLKATGLFVPFESWDVKATGRGDLALLRRAVPRIRLASGEVVAEISVSGPWKSPSIEGPVEVLPGARLAVEGVDLPLEDLKAKGYLEGNRGLILDWADARVGEGRIHAEGLLGAKGLRPKTLRFLVELRDIRYEWPKQVTYQFDGDGIVTGTLDQPEVRGEVRLKQFRYTRRTNWKTMVFDYLKRRPREVGSTVPQGGTFVDISVRGAQDLKVENNLADLSLSVDLRARGYLQRTALFGRVEIQEGKVRFRTQEYDAMRSAIEFLGETQPVPLLDVHLRTTVQQYTVNLDVEGPLDKYQVTLSSTPPLAQNDLVALLSVGATPTAVTPGGATPTGATTGKTAAGNDSSTAAEATSFITGQVQDELESQVSDLLGFDQFHLDPAYSTSNQTTVPRVTVGKSVTQSLFARYSTAIGGEVEQDAEVQYTLTPAVQLLGTWGDKGSRSNGSFGGKVRFRFTFR